MLPVFVRLRGGRGCAILARDTERAPRRGKRQGAGMADILSQEEVDLLLNAVSDGEIGDAEEEVEADQELHLVTYDFRRPERVSKEQLKGLQSLFDAFAREVSIVFPPFLRTVVRVDLTSIDQLTYDEFILSVARPTALSIIDMSPLEGTAVLGDESVDGLSDRRPGVGGEGDDAAGAA